MNGTGIKAASSSFGADARVGTDEVVARHASRRDGITCRVPFRSSIQESWKPRQLGLDV